MDTSGELNSHCTTVETTNTTYGVMSSTHCSLFHYEPRTLQANSHRGEVYKAYHPLYSTPTTIRSWGCQPASTFLFRSPTQSFFSSHCIFLDEYSQRVKQISCSLGCQPSSICNLKVLGVSIVWQSKIQEPELRLGLSSSALPNADR